MVKIVRLQYCCYEWKFSLDPYTSVIIDSNDELTTGQKASFEAKSFKNIQEFDWKTGTIESIQELNAYNRWLYSQETEMI